MSLLSGLPFSLPTERSTKKIQLEDGKLEAQGVRRQADSRTDWWAGVRSKAVWGVVSHLPPLHLELQHDQQVPVALPCGSPLETTIN